MLIEKDTKEATSKFFAVADIDARAAAAYTANKQLFNSAQHTTKVELVDSILKSNVYRIRNCISNSSSSN